MSIVASLKPAGPNGFGYGSTADDVTEGVDLSGKTFLLTGCNSGIGLETLRSLTKRGARVIAAARTAEKARLTCDQVDGLTEPVVCELSEPASVRACAAQVKELGHELHGIICNAGIMALPKLNQSHGYELQFFTNHMGHFILVTELLEALSASGRVVAVSSEAHRSAPRGGIELDNLSGERGYAGWAAYGQSKLANILFVKELARRFEGSEKAAIAVHPGVIATNLTRHMHPLLGAGWKMLEPLVLKSTAQGAATQTYAAAHPGAARHSGEYLSDCNPKKPSRHAQNSELARALWEKSEEIAASL